MNIQFVAGFGPITTDSGGSRAFWAGHLGIPMEEIAPDYFGTDDLGGVNAFATWPLSQAAESCFGTDAWPTDVPVPHAWIELDVETPDAVAEAGAELEGSGHRLLRHAGPEPWGQVVTRLLSPEGLLVGITYTPWMHHEHHDDHDGHEHAGHAHEGHDA
jgi:hypothetical protein